MPLFRASSGLLSQSSRRCGPNTEVTAEVTMWPTRCSGPWAFSLRAIDVVSGQGCFNLRAITGRLPHPCSVSASRLGSDRRWTGWRPGILGLAPQSPTCATVAAGCRGCLTALRLFAGSEPTPCAFARSAMGPFYCPRDQRIYLDTAFFNDLQNKFGGCTDSNACKFSEAYVIAHEVGHHVQNELGILPRVTQAQQASSSKAESNALQVRVELQADCLAGIWANRSQQKNNFLDPGDVDQALQTASAIGDDRLQKESQGYVVPDAFTHGTSAQRKRWFMNGFNSGEALGLRCVLGAVAVVQKALEPSGRSFGQSRREWLGIGLPRGSSIQSLPSTRTVCLESTVFLISEIVWTWIVFAHVFFDLKPLNGGNDAIRGTRRVEKLILIRGKFLK